MGPLRSTPNGLQNRPAIRRAKSDESVGDSSTASALRPPRIGARNDLPRASRTEKTRHFEGSAGSQSDRENTSLPRVRVAIGPRKHVTSRDPGRNRTEKTRHFQGSGLPSDRENTSHRGTRVGTGLRKHVTSRRTLGTPKGGPQDSPERSKIVLQDCSLLI